MARFYFFIFIFMQNKLPKAYTCPCCGSTVRTYRVHFSTLHINILRKVFRWCVEHKTHMIHKSDIQDLTHTEYGNFYILQRFWFLYYLEYSEGNKMKGWYWWVAVRRIAEFLDNKWKVAEYSEKNTATKEQSVSENRLFYSDIVNKYKGKNLFDEDMRPSFRQYLEDDTYGKEYIDQFLYSINCQTDEGEDLKSLFQ